MIEDPGDNFFPYNIVRMFEIFIADGVDPDITFFRRKLMPNDPDQSCSIVPAKWSYRKNSRELGGRPEATVDVYSIMVQTLIVDADEVRGLRLHSLYAKRVRELLARPGPIQIGLRDLSTTDSRGIVEKSTQWWVEDQVFHTAPVEGNWRFLSTLEFILETQIIK